MTPSVTNTSGYITGSTKTGTAVTVTASELESGTKSITANGTGIDVSGYSTVDVSVANTVTMTITLTGDINYAYIQINGTKYYEAGTYSVPVGASAYLLAYSESNSIKIDGETVATGSQGVSAHYNYTIPAHNLSVSLYFSRTVASVTVTSPTISITSNDTYDVNDYAIAEVNVTPPLQAKTVTPTSSQQVITPDQAATVTALNINTTVPTGQYGSALYWTSATNPFTATLNNGDVVDIEFQYYRNGYDRTYLYDGTATVSNDQITFTAKTSNNLYTINPIVYLTAQNGNRYIYVHNVSDDDDGSNLLTVKITRSNPTYYGLSQVTVGAGIVAEQLSVTTNGTYTAPSGRAYSPVVVSVGGIVPANEKDVNFIDYDGTLLYSYTASEFASLSELPENPSHTGLTAEGWNWSLADAKTYVTAHGKLWIGQTYKTTDEKTHLYIKLEDPDYLAPYVAIAVNGTCTVDWGDGSATGTMTGTSLTTTKYLGHAYSSTGSYVITLAATSGSYQFYGSSSYANVLRPVGAANNRARDRFYCNCLTKIEIGKNAVIGNYAFQPASFETITIPKSITAINTYAFNTCTNLKAVVIPNTVTELGSYAFANCNLLHRISMAKGLTTIGTYCFQNDFSLRSITFPDSVTSVGSNCMVTCRQLNTLISSNGLTSVPASYASNCYSLKYATLPSNATDLGGSALAGTYSLNEFTIPANVTSIGNSAFQNVYGLQKCHILPTTPPTLGTTVFSGLQSVAVLYVPQGKLTDYQTATGWDAWSTYMQEEPS